MEGIQEPVGRALHLVLRRAVLDHAVAERRRVHPPLVHVGRPGGPEDVFAVETGDTLDHALRCDVVAALLRRSWRPGSGSVPMMWLTRTGELDLQDVDVAWMAAARAASAEAGIGLTLVVVNRHGWRDPRSGVRREWKRLRQR
ncbi:hypothetical protein ABLE68_20985 [Nocardioides sp. CN2-186]|uniref:hypothetical protein n=1 Tax=Nocardioides tweenelious TaxID=3156607 RepID=UPI0032B45702